MNVSVLVHQDAQSTGVTAIPRVRAMDSGPSLLYSETMTIPMTIAWEQQQMGRRSRDRGRRTTVEVLSRQHGHC